MEFIKFMRKRIVCIVYTLYLGFLFRFVFSSSFMFQDSLFYHFLSVWRTCFSQSLRVRLLARDSFSFPSESAFISSSFLRDSFTRCRINDSLSLFFQYLKNVVGPGGKPGAISSDQQVGRQPLRQTCARGALEHLDCNIPKTCTGLSFTVQNGKQAQGEAGYLTLVITNAVWNWEVPLSSCFNPSQSSAREDRATSGAQGTQGHVLPGIVTSF